MFHNIPSIERNITKNIQFANVYVRFYMSHTVNERTKRTIIIKLIYEITINKFEMYIIPLLERCKDRKLF